MHDKLADWKYDAQIDDETDIDLDEKANDTIMNVADTFANGMGDIFHVMPCCGQTLQCNVIFVCRRDGRPMPYFSAW